MRWDGDTGGRPPAQQRARVADAVARVLNEWGKGLTYSEIATELGLSKGVVAGIVHRSSGPDAEKARRDHRRIMADRDVARKTGGRKDPERDACVLAQWADGKSASQIGDTLGVTRNTVIGIVSRAGAKCELPTRARPKRSEKQDEVARVRTPLAELPARRAQCEAEGKAFIAQLTLIDNPAFVAAEEPPADLYRHMRTERDYYDAMAAMARPARGERAERDL